jgi:large subunit GTPase 1
LDEFLTTAQLAGTDFTAGAYNIIFDFKENANSLVRKPERQNIKVVANPSLTAATHNPYLLSPAEERSMRLKQKDNRERLQVPRRPAWTRKTTVLELEKSERDSFLEWRRGLAE